MGWQCPPYYGKSKYYQKKKEKALKKIAELQKIVEECDKEISKNEDK
jgi:hypothetical protein